MISNIPIDFQTLNIVRGITIPTSCCNLQVFTIAEVDIHAKPWRCYQKGRLPCQREKTNHIPQQPGLHRTSITVSRESVWLCGVVCFGDVAGPFNRQALVARKIEEVRRRKTRLVARIEDCVKGGKGSGVDKPVGAVGI